MPSLPSSILSVNVTLRDLSAPLKNPYQQLVGWCLLHNPKESAVLRHVLEETCDQKGLIGWISSCFLSQVNQKSVTALHPAIQSHTLLNTWWHKFDMVERGSKDAIAVLPFYSL